MKEMMLRLNERMATGSLWGLPYGNDRRKSGSGLEKLKSSTRDVVLK